MRDKKNELADASARATFIQTMERYLAAWKADPAEPSCAPEEIARVRTEMMLPILNGALLGLAKAIWETAPPGATADGLVAHLMKMLPNMVEYAVAGGPAGHFWVSVEAQLKVMDAAEGQGHAVH